MKTYKELFASGHILPDKRSTVLWYFNRIKEPARRDRYEEVAKRIGNSMPWWVVGLLHQMESSFDFSKHLHNGDPLTARTKNVPAGRPVAGDPPFKWEESAVDALQYDKAHEVQAWDIESALGFLERYNGLGYRRRGINTPYLWSFTNHYSKGRYVRDGIFDPNAVSKQAGACATLYMLIEKGLVDLEFETPPEEDDAEELPSWARIAHAELGISEIAGSKDNPRIIEYHRATTLKASHDEVAWCSAFVSWCLEKAGVPSTRSAAARSYMNFGKKVDAPVRGDIVVFWRGSPNGWQGHVGFFWDWVDDRSLLCLGGNQSNKVSIATYPKSQVLGFRRVVV